MDRVLWTVGLAVLCCLVFLALWWGWRRRARRQSDIPPLPPVPALEPEPLTEPLAGVYVSTTRSGSWQDRVVVHGLGRRARATVVLGEDGVLIDRIGEDPIFLPAGSLVAVDTTPGIAGKVMGLPTGILLITWQLGGVRLDSGIRADDPDEQAGFLDAARRMLAGRGTSQAPTAAEPAPGSGSPAAEPLEKGQA